MNLTSSITGEWIKSIPKYVRMNAWCHLKLNIGPKVFRWEVKDEEREQLIQSIDNLEQQLSLFEQALAELPEELREAMIEKYLKPSSEMKVDPKLLSQGRSHVSRFFQGLQKAGEIQIVMMRNGQYGIFRTAAGIATAKKPKVQRRIQSIASLWRIRLTEDDLLYG